ncbi:septal ring lytic transglycosylase RlpA family protein [Iodobacter sp. CM08]|uniref:septal ring lytic transglycosylase RlpA family protein n=1 Tax=Iodobacter sp. CM08 TaxID=3085902 RepID=UPI0029821462|nr:septal ring lytic transglycosylase RlpA family protein [Iodobacter sp. CM08]MDW5415050.1 septal ring lytic transglycosylase RlpA family protein [Iodobacter sp. CM08]
MKHTNYSALIAALLLAACSTTPQPPSKPLPSKPTTPGATTPAQYSCNYTAKGSGAFYKDDGPMDSFPSGIDQIPEPLPRWEPLHRWANNPYTVLGQNFTPLPRPGELKQQGTASWYGRKFHGQKTSTGEIYDMFAITAAHPTLPIPSYARVTNVKNGRSIIVRVNDRGPFLHGRVMDLSFLAACRLGYTMDGSAEVTVESLLATDTPSAVAAAVKPVTSAQISPAKAIPLADSGNGSVYLQLGAFGSLANAESFRDHLSSQLDSDANKLLIQSIGSLHRVRLGPYPDRQSAQLAASRISGEHQLPSMLSH